MNDSAVVRLLLSLEGHRQAIQNIIDTIQESDHPKAAEIAEALYEQCWFPAWPEHVAAPYLDNSRWAIEVLPSGVHGRLISRREANRRNIEVIDL